MGSTTYAQSDSSNTAKEKPSKRSAKEKSEKTRSYKIFASVHVGAGISRTYLTEKKDSVSGLPASRPKESWNFGSDVSLHLNEEFGVMLSLNVARLGDNHHSFSLGDPSQGNTGDILKRSWTYVQLGIGPKALFGNYAKISFSPKIVVGLQTSLRETLKDSAGTVIGSWDNLESTRPKIDGGLSLNINFDYPLNDKLYIGVYNRSYFGLRRTSSTNVLYQGTFFGPLSTYTIFGTHLGVTLAYQF